MLCVYPADCTDFSNNGMGVISPSSAIVKETLNGSYELEIVHPYDTNGKWRRLADGYIVRAPVPSAITPQVALAYKAISEGKMIYEVNTRKNPLVLRSTTTRKYKKLGKYKKGTQVIVLDQATEELFEVACPDGKHGFMPSASLRFIRNESQYAGATDAVMEPRQLRDQPFRIYRVVPELDKVTAYARHIFYDLMDNMVQSFSPRDTTTGQIVIDRLSAACLSEHDFTFYSDLSTTAKEVTFENLNPVDCLLGDGGIIENYGGEVVRDWFDVFIVNRVGNDTNIEIRQGKNLTGIKYDVDATDVTTRIMPTGQDKDGKVLYLPEVFVDSPLAENYPFPKWIHLEVSDAKEVTKGKSSEKKSKAQCYTEMRQAAQDEFDKGCDLPKVTLTVEFIDVTETEEYKPYAFLQTIFLGDAVRVIARGIGVSVSMRMTEYSYDCLTRKYTSMTLGTVADTLSGNMITSRQIPSGMITGSKLALGSVGIGQLQEGAVGELQIQEAAIKNAHIQNAAISAANIQTAAIEFAHIAAATINSLNTGAIEATSAKIASLTAADIQTDSLAAALAAFTVITCGTATFDAATIRHLVAQSMNLDYGVAGQVFIRNLAVEYAQMIGASIGNLCIKASDGNYYTIEKENLNTMDATSEVLLTIMASLAQQESQSLSQNVKLGLQYRYQQGKVQVNHNWFLGYTKDENGQLVIDPEQAEVVRRIYREYLEGASMTQIARGLEADGILTGAGRTRWYNSTVNKILRNEKYYGDALLQKTYTRDFLTKSRVKNEGIVPQYYVQGDHEPIISKEMFLLVQEEIARRQEGKKDASGRTSRYSTCHCFSHIVYCDKCGGLFRRVHWNNRGCKSIVWRCSNRLKKADEKCLARTVREDDLESVVLRAINETFCQSDGFMSVLESNARMAVESKSGLSLKALDEKIASLQRKLVEKVNHREDYEELAEQIQRLQAEKAQRESDGANKKRNAQALQDLHDFIRSQGNEITEFDEKLVRRLVEKITVSDKTVTVLFKSGQSVEING